MLSTWIFGRPLTVCLTVSCFLNCGRLEFLASIGLGFRWYLSNHLQCVDISNSHSDLLTVLSGVPQGPMLFVIYINDIPLRHWHVNSLIFLFPNDAKLCKGIHYVTDSTLLKHDLHTLHVWSLENHHQFHISKCVSLSSNCKFNTTYTIDFNFYHSWILIVAWEFCFLQLISLRVLILTIYTFHGI